MQIIYKYGCLEKCKNKQLVYVFMAIVYNLLNARVCNTIELLHKIVDKLYTIASYIYGQQYRIVSFLWATLYTRLIHLWATVELLF